MKIVREEFVSPKTSFIVLLFTQGCMDLEIWEMLPCFVVDKGNPFRYVSIQSKHWKSTLLYFPRFPVCVAILLFLPFLCTQNKHAFLKIFYTTFSVSL